MDERQPLARLARWYANQCDGEWEHDFGVRLESLDNPGWELTVDARAARIEEVDHVLLVEGDPPRAENGNLGGPSWLTCEIRGRQFVGAGDPTRLAQLIEVFLDWVEREPGRR